MSISTQSAAFKQILKINPKNDYFYAILKIEKYSRSKLSLSNSQKEITLNTFHFILKIAITTLFDSAKIFIVIYYGNCTPSNRNIMSSVLKIPRAHILMFKSTAQHKFRRFILIFSFFKFIFNFNY